MSALTHTGTDNGVALEQLVALPLRAENPYIKEWKERGGKVAGFNCSYVPEELICALSGANPVLPIRMGAQGCGTSEDAEIHLHKFVCGYAKCLLQFGLDGEYDFLDGIVWTSCCEQLRRTFEYWRDEVKPGFTEMIGVPHLVGGENRQKWFSRELRNFVDALAGQTGTQFDEQALRGAIQTYNTYRTLMAKLYELRAQEQPKLTGSEAMRIFLAGMTMPKGEFNELLSRALQGISARPGMSDVRARLMICGSYMDDTFLIDLIEETGALVVTDTLCSGAKSIEGLVDETIDPFEAVVERYLGRVSCPRMADDFERRVAFAKRQAAMAKVDGVILQRIPFCDNHTVENMMEGGRLEREGMPTLQLEREYLAADKGRLKTRIQAFLEKIGK